LDYARLLKLDQSSNFPMNRGYKTFCVRSVL
jgi:hypothetical protein